MDWLIFLIRLAITLTFLILAAGGPYAILQLRRFIRNYMTAHKILEARVEALEQWRTSQEHNTP